MAHSIYLNCNHCTEFKYHIPERMSSKMEFVILLLFISAFFPIFRFTVSRLFLLFKLRRLCKKIGAELKLNRWYSLFKKINGNSNDMYIKTDRCIYSIKLFGFFSKKKYFCFGDNHTYYLKDLTFSLLPSIADSMNYKSKKYTNINFESFLPSSRGFIEIKPCFLLSPVLSKGMKISCIRNNKMIEIISGDHVSNGFFYTVEGLVKELHSKK